MEPISRLEKAFFFAPMAGIALFTFAYLKAAACYPGGTMWDPHTVGFTPLNNFWCDLMRTKTYAGARNAAHSVAMVGAVVLPISLMPFWTYQASLFSMPARAIVFLGGVFGMAAAACLPLAHDLAIRFAVALVAPALLLSGWRAMREREYPLLLMMTVAALVSSANFLMWHFSWQLRWMPLVQLLALGSSLLAILAMHHRVDRQRNQGA